MKIYKVYIKFLKYLKPYWFKEIVLLILMCVTSAGTLASPYILKIIIDDVFPAKDFTLLIKILLILVGINIVRLTVGYISDYLHEWISNRVMLDIRMDLFNKLLKYPMSFFDKEKPGDITHRIYDETNTVQNMLTGSLVRFIRSTLTLIGLIIALSLLNFKLFIISMLVVPFIILNMRYFQPKVHENVEKSREKDADILNYLVERLKNIKLIKNYNRYNYENLNLYEKIRELINYRIKTTKYSSFTQNLSTFFITLSPVIIFGFGGKQVITGAMTLGSLIAFIQYLNRIFRPFRDLMGLYWELVRTSVSMKRIFEYLDLPIQKNDGSIKNIDFNRIVQFENTYFAYNGNYVLKNLNLQIYPGKKYALVGASGCGKSTLINLLCRFYEPQSGAIKIGDKNIDEFDLHSLRQKIALVPQDHELFSDSIKNNLLYSNPDASYEEMLLASKIVGLNEYLKSSDNGFDEPVGDKGNNLSGGQKQRIAIAQGILKNSEVIVLDEATSALDSERERQIFTNIAKLFNNKTVILISHRLSAVKYADEIICLRKGKVVEKGTHKELINLKGVYYELFNQQS